MSLSQLKQKISACRLCAASFQENTATKHTPRPIVWAQRKARILIAGQAPGMRVHESGKPFTDPSGDRLREWLGVGEDVFYDQDIFAIVPMAFCFPGYNDRGADLPPPKRCATTWRQSLLSQLRDVRLTILVGQYAQTWHLPDTKGMSVTGRVATWRDHAPSVFPLPHPSWRNTGWLKKNPWFAAQLLPELQRAVQTQLAA